MNLPLPALALTLSLLYALPSAQAIAREHFEEKLIGWKGERYHALA